MNGLPNPARITVPTYGLADKGPLALSVVEGVEGLSAQYPLAFFKEAIILIAVGY
jgi:hypothetical protein